MAKNTLKASDFNTREDLENEVIKLTGSGTEDKPDFSIEGKREDLERLLLTDIRAVYGVRCVILDIPTETKKDVINVDRGKQTDFGLDGNLSVNKNK